MNVVKNEPVLTALTTVITAALALLVAFGVAFTAPQIAAVVGFVGAAYGIFALVRSKVTPTDKVVVDLS